MQYVKMKSLPVKQFELLPVTPVFMHPKNTANGPGYYSDIIMHADFELDNINIVADNHNMCRGRLDEHMIITLIFVLTFIGNPSSRFWT